MTRPQRRRVPLDPGPARAAAAETANEKARTAPHTLTAEELDLIPGKLLLDLGNGGHLRHLGLGLPVPAPPAAKWTATRPAAAPLTDEQLRKMSAPQISRAIAGGRVPGIGVRRRTWGQR
jgi:hypothetical protein